MKYEANIIHLLLLLEGWRENTTINNLQHDITEQFAKQQQQQQVPKVFV